MPCSCCATVLLSRTDVHSPDCPLFPLRSDDCLREILGSVANTLLAPNSSAWVQATLPVKLGGLGIRDAVSVAPSAFLASSHSTAELVEAILPPHISAVPAPHLEEAMLFWSAGHSHPAPEGAAASWQKGWEVAGTTTTANRLLLMILSEPVYWL